MLHAALNGLTSCPLEERSKMPEPQFSRALAELFIRETGLKLESWGKVIAQAMTDGCTSKAARVWLGPPDDTALPSYDSMVDI